MNAIPIIAGPFACKGPAALANGLLIRRVRRSSHPGPSGPACRKLMVYAEKGSSQVPSMCLTHIMPPAMPDILEVPEKPARP